MSNIYQNLDASCWEEGPRRSQGPLGSQEAKLAENGYPRRACLDAEGEFNSLSDSLERPQRGKTGSDSNSDNENDCSDDWDDAAFEYSSEYGASLHGMPMATLAPFSDRKYKLHSGQAVHVPAEDEEGKQLVDENGEVQQWYTDHGDLDNRRMALLETADYQLQRCGIKGKHRQQVIESLKREKKQGMIRWSAHYHGGEGAIVGWCAFYTSVERVRKSGLMHRLFSISNSDEADIPSLSDSLSKVERPDQIQRFKSQAEKFNA